MPFWDRREIDQLNSEIRLLKDKIDELSSQLHHRNEHIDKNRYLLERAIAVAEENQLQIGEIRNTQISILSSGISNSIHDQSINHINLSPHAKQTLFEAVKEIHTLLDQLSTTYPTRTQSEKAFFAAKAVEQIEQDSKIRRRIVKALKSCGVSALQEAVDNPLFNVISAFLEGFLDP